MECFDESTQEKIDWVYEQVLTYFDGDEYKTVDWFRTPNPNLGNVTPLYMLQTEYKVDNLRNWVENVLDENI